MPIPRTNNLEHLQQNLYAYDLVLDDLTMDVLGEAYRK